jgi:transcriptional regulator with PAS, ATPase and Fis domain
MRRRDAQDMTTGVTSTADLKAATLSEKMLSYENKLIKEALIASQGSVTRAAHSLGVSHQRLIYILESRQKDLLSVRTPIKTRERHSKNEE